jgi:hypothetical protein
MTRFLCLALALAALPLAGCGGSNDPKDSSSGRDTRYDQALKFSQCMRSHGLAGFPDPVQQSGGGISLSIKEGSGIDPGSPKFKAAEAACRKFAPRRGTGKPMTAAEQQRFLAYSQCMRTHGLPQFPDPKFSGGGVQLRLPQGLGPDSPSLKAAENACRSLQPGAMAGKGGGGSKGGG